MSLVLLETCKRCRVAINYVLCIPHFSINIGAKLSHIILSLHLYKNYYDYNMAKRQANGETKSFDNKFEIDTDTFVVVSNVNGHLLVHIRKFNGNFPTKGGSACSPTNTSSYWSC